MPERVLKELTPERMRYWEDWEREKKEMKENGIYVPPPLEGVELHYKHDHEMIRHAQLPFRSQFCVVSQNLGKVDNYYADPNGTYLRCFGCPFFLTSALADRRGLVSKE